MQTPLINKITNEQKDYIGYRYQLPFPFFECPLKGSNGKYVATTNQGGGDCDAVKSFFFLPTFS